MVLQKKIIVSEVLAVYQCQFIRGQCYTSDGDTNNYCEMLECCGESFTTTTGKSVTAPGN